uniref:TATA element modulatory factor 1 TATA binding domain-containing protein n=1 Tax=Spongospora subterranea TaxID=70186 RepID=A0A0H5R9K7_9EUKA|eukprot:CRZ10805.1 hypothetical protein [Spongospora subterranea]
MSFDFQRWATKSLAIVEGHLDQAFGLDSIDNAVAPASIPTNTVPVIPQTTEANKSPLSPVIDVLSRIPAETVVEEAQPAKQSSPARCLSSTEKSYEPALASVIATDESQSPKSVAILLRRREAQLSDLSTQLAQFHDDKGDLEAKLRQASRIEAELRQSLEQTKKSLSDQLQKKQDQIDEILKEGEQWSLKQLKLETITKGLRKQLQERQTDIDTIKADLELKTATLNDAAANRLSQEQAEQKLLERIALLTSQYGEVKSELDRINRESTQLDVERSGSVAVVERLEAKLKALEVEAAHWKIAYDEQSELHARLSVMQDQLKEATVREESLVRNISELTLELETLRGQSQGDRNSLRMQLHEVRGQLQEAQLRAEQVQSEIPSATRPLLKQIETFQKSLKSRTESWESREQFLIAQVADAEKLRSEYQQAKASLEIAHKQLCENFQALQVEARDVANDRSDALSKLEAAHARLESIIRDTQKKDLHIDSLNKQVQSLVDQRTLDESRLRDEVEAANSINSELREELENSRQAFRDLETSFSHRNDLGKTARESLQLHSRRPSNSSDPSNNGFAPFPKAINGPMNAMDLHQRLRRQEAELQSLRDRLLTIESDRDKLMDQLVSESIKSASFAEESQTLQKQHDDLLIRHDIALHIIGEKTDQVDELQADLTESRGIFKEQISSLVDQVERLRNRQ